MSLLNSMLKSPEVKMYGKNRMTTLFRELSTKESVHTSVYDFRKVGDLKNKTNIVNNKIIITCEHATNNFHQYAKFLSEKDKQFLNTHWAYDIGAKDITINLAEYVECFSICTNFSRLILDPNRGLLSNTLIRKFVEIDHELDVNKVDDRVERVNLFYNPYFEILYEALNFINQNILLICILSHRIFRKKN